MVYKLVVFERSYKCINSGDDIPIKFSNLVKPEGYSATRVSELGGVIVTRPKVSNNHPPPFPWDHEPCFMS